MAESLPRRRTRGLRAALAGLCLGLGACATVGDWKDSTLDWVDDRPSASVDRQDFGESSAAEDPRVGSPGFSAVRVKPWERDVLARPDMAWEPDAHRGTHRGHIFFSKEGSLLGGNAGGGGCGCN